MDFKEKIKHNKILAWLYGQETDFNIGRSFFGKFTSASGELNTILLIYLGWETYKTKINSLSSVIFSIILFIYIFGKFYRKLNLLEVDQFATAKRNPVSKIQLEAAEIIIDRFGYNK